MTGQLFTRSWKPCQPVTGPPTAAWPTPSGRPPNLSAAHVATCQQCMNAHRILTSKGAVALDLPGATRRMTETQWKCCSRGCTPRWATRPCSRAQQRRSPSPDRAIAAHDNSEGASEGHLATIASLPVAGSLLLGVARHSTSRKHRRARPHVSPAPRSASDCRAQVLRKESRRGRCNGRVAGELVSTANHRRAERAGPLNSSPK